MPYSNEEISEIIQEFMQAVGTRQYIGSRYVPIFGRKGEDSIIWDNTGTYEPLTIVLYQGNSYTSRQFVPVGVDISNQEFWANTGNFNAQVEQYRQTVLTFDNRITTNADAISAETTARETAISEVEADIAAETSARESAITQVSEDISDETSARETADSNLQDSIDAETTAREGAITQVNGEISSLSNDIASNTELIQAESAINATQNAQLAGTEPSGLKSLIDDIGYTMLLQHEMLFFGDSWGRNNAQLIPTSLAKMLNVKLHNYSVSAVGWIEGGSDSIPNQIQAALSDTTVNANDVQYIVIYAGSNDVSHDHFTSGDYTTIITNACNALKDKFKRATIHIFFNNRFKYGSTNYYKINNQIRLWNQVSANIAAYSNAIPHPDSTCYVMAPTAFDADLVHPTVAASQHLVARLANMIGGGSFYWDDLLDTKVIPLASNDSFWQGNMYCRVTNYELFLNAYVYTASSGTASTKIVANGSGIIPVNLFTNATVNQKSNQMSIPMCNADGLGLCHMALKFSDGSMNYDNIYMAKDDGTINNNAHLFGSSSFRLFQVV